MITEHVWKTISKEPYETWGPLLNKLLGESTINTKNRVAMFLAQAAHETGGFTRLSENLNYSAQGLAATWPNRYRQSNGQPNSLATSLHRTPEKIANHTYANRMGNGDVSSGDGWRYRGRGIFQLTGKTNYQLFFRSIDSAVNPDLLLEPEFAIRSAIWYWTTNGLNKSADIGDIRANTKAINGGVIGLDDRTSKYNKLLQVL